MIILYPYPHTPIFEESMLESAIESVDSNADSPKIGVWVRALSLYQATVRQVGPGFLSGHKRSIIRQLSSPLYIVCSPFSGTDFPNMVLIIVLLCLILLSHKTMLCIIRGNMLRIVTESTFITTCCSQYAAAFHCYVWLFLYTSWLQLAAECRGCSR